MIKSLSVLSVSLGKIIFVFRKNFEDMFQVIAFMFAGIATGYIFRRRKAGFVQFLITGLIWALLFLLGLEVGHNDAVVKKFATLGLEASVIAIAATLGSIVAAKWLWGKGRKKNGSSANDALL